MSQRTPSRMIIFLKFKKGKTFFLSILEVKFAKPDNGYVLNKLIFFFLKLQ
jgi:hypothetical protein